MAQFYADRVAIGSHRAKTPEGYLLCLDIPFARTGFQKYRENEIKSGGDPSKEITVLRPHDEVMNPATIASFEGKPVTSPHPPNFVDPQNYNQYARGHAQNVHAGPRLADGEHSLVADLLITDAALIDRIESGAVKELSAGYDVEYVPDAHDPKIYRQTKIRGNHIAVVPSGRAGNSVKILDSIEEESVAETAAITEERVSVSTFMKLADWLRGGSRTMDAESEAVERNEKANAEALKRAKARNQDAEKEKEEVEKEEAFKKATDALNAGATAFQEAAKSLVDAVKSLKTRDAEKEEEEYEEEEKEKEKGKDKKRGKDKRAKDKKEEDDKHEEDAEKEEKEKEEDAQDGDLIPVETLTGKEVPENPIPGADKALDALRAMKPLIAKSKDAALVEQYNNAIRELKGRRTGDGSAYRSLLNPKRPEDVENAETVRMLGGATDAKGADDFVSVARSFHRRNPNEAASEIRADRKEKK